MAKHYEKIEAQTRQEIEMHKKMLADFEQGMAKNPKDPQENPSIKNMRPTVKSTSKLRKLWQEKLPNLPSFIPSGRKSWRASKPSK